MNRQLLRTKVQATMRQLIAERGYASPLDVLLSMEKLSAKNVDDWRSGKIPYLERVIQMNLPQLNVLLAEMKEVARDMDLTPSLTAYRRRTRSGRLPLRFSKSGAPHLEERYATHFLSRKLRGTKALAKSNPVPPATQR